MLFRKCASLSPSLFSRSNLDDEKSVDAVDFAHVVDVADVAIAVVVVAVVVTNVADVVVALVVVVIVLFIVTVHVVTVHDVSSVVIVDAVV